MRQPKTQMSPEAEEFWTRVGASIFRAVFSTSLAYVVLSAVRWTGSSELAAGAAFGFTFSAMWSLAK